MVKKDTTEIFHLLTVEKKGNKLSIISSRSFASIEEVFKVAETNIPVLLHIDGKGILNKKVDTSNDADVNWLKTIDFNSIYHTNYQEQEISYMSFCRANVAEEVLELFRKQNYQILDIYVGSFLGLLLKNSMTKTAFISGELFLTIDEEEQIEFSKNDQKNPTYQIGNDALLSSHIPLYACAVNFYLKPEEITKSRSQKINQEEIIYQKAFNGFGIIMLVGFFISLLISYFLIQYYGSKNASLNLESIYSNESYKQLQALEKKKQQQLLILNESGLASTSFFSHYAYDFLKTVPTSIKLNEANFIPLSSELKPDKKLFFNSKTIIIKGQTSQEEFFNSWLNSLKEVKWIRKFEIVNLKRDKKNISQFEVKILI